MTSEPYWYKVLKHFEQRHYFRNGLTIPFLIGSRKFIEPKKPIDSINTFFEELRKSEHFTTIMKCGDIGEYIIGLLDSETKSLMAKIPLSNRNGFGNIIITDSSFKNVSDFEEAISLLHDLYDDNIKTGRYSKVDGFWNKFDDTDTRRLKEVTMK